MTVLTLLLTTFVFGAPREITLDKAALSQRLRFYQGIKELEAPFTQVKSFKELGMTIGSSGQFRLKRPSEVTWEVKQPSRVVIHLTRDAVRIETGEGSSASVKTFRVADAPREKDVQSMRGLVAWLELDAVALDKQYQVYDLGQNHFRFKPRDASVSPFEDLEMRLQDSGQLVGLVIHEKSGDSIDIKFGAPKVKRQ